MGSSASHSSCSPCSIWWSGKACAPNIGRVRGLPYERTVLPPDEPDRLYRVAQSLRAEPDQPPELIWPDGHAVELPQELYDVLRHAAGAFLDGLAVTLTSRHEVLTTQEAAELLHVSRQTVVRLLEEG